MGSRFDVKVEFDRIVPEADIKVTVNGGDGAAAFGRALQFVSKEAGVDASAVMVRDVALTKPGRYTIVATDGQATKTVTWQVFATGPRKADWERAVMDTIMLDQAVRVAKEFAARQNDTLVLVTADHSHGLSIVGTVNDAAPGEQMRDKVEVYEKAGFPDYPAANGDGHPARLDVSRRLAIFFSGFPDHYETFGPKLDGPFVPAVSGPDKLYIANDRYRTVPGAVLRVGNLPRTAPQGVHTGEDIVLTAIGPGAERVTGFMDNTALFRVMADALGLGREDAP